MPPLQYHGLQIEEDMRWQRAAWKLQRLGWLGFISVVVLSLLGVLGPGWLGSRRVADGEFRVAYERFLRRSALTTLEASVPVEEREARLWLDRGYAERMGLEGVVPEPDSVETDGEDLLFTFKAAEGATSVAVQLAFEPREAGRVSGHIRADGDPIRLWHFVYP